MNQFHLTHAEMGKPSLSKRLFLYFTLIVSAFSGTDGYFNSQWLQCIYSSPDLSDMVYISSYVFNKAVVSEFNSTVGKFVGYDEYGMYVAEYWNNNTDYLQRLKAEVDGFCKPNAVNYNSAIRDKTEKPKIKLSSVKQAGGRHPAVLVCSAYDFYPEQIKMSWTRDGKEVTTEVTSTEEQADGDWYYQIHSHLEYTPRSGERISCVVDHASSNVPIITDWDPSIPDPERNKIVIGASGLVLGVIIAAAGLIYYKKKSAGRTLVPH
ncbi:rano class II histocompatibility antigen, A beta chain-like isoform X2 [Megalobrama amblycephala]|uniref:rano class II histocompatibility antigen, A beta chain-like isoform X2 n=1 Tax=Megalobrama amblycephala TaxID=75352 RepID=UPI002013F2FC|nr:rano class II histocompatibility antigen, A beta chain-like isoform X2 [Megalobrama amblycephala]